MQVVAVNPVEPKASRVEAAAQVLRDGGVVALPTETFYGLAADSSNETALEALNRLKRKPRDAPLLLLAADVAQVEQASSAPPPSFSILSQAFWPGPLTLVLPAAPGLSLRITGGRGTVGVRVPGLALPRELAAALGRPITGISANLHGEPAPRTAAAVAAAFPEGVALLLDGGATAGGAPSTLLDLTTVPPRVLRRGIVPAKALVHFVPDLQDAVPRPAL